MSSLKFILFIIILTFTTEAASVPEMDRLMRENRLLRSEYPLARTSQLYVLFDLTEKKIQMKARGTVLKELSVENVTVWGTSIEPKPLTLIKKSAFLNPKRTKIKPKKNGEASPSELYGLEVDDMPVRYRLNFDDCVWVYIRPRPNGMISDLFSIFARLKSFIIIRPIVTLWNALHQRTFTEIYIDLSEKDAKCLYWALPEGLKSILYGFDK